jgi:Set1/Ash2 histone methyltransferase complex subunit ASH2
MAQRTASTTVAPAMRGVRMSVANSAAQLKIDDTGRTVTGELGFRTARTEHGVKIGSWFCEARVLDPQKPNGHVRLGWMTSAGEIQAPVGYDEHSYGWRDVDGSKVQRSRRTAYGAAFKSGNVVGMLIRIVDPRARSATKEGTTIEYFLDGVSQGIAFDNLPDQRYYPAVSLYMGATVQMNFGPDFEYAPPQIGAKAAAGATGQSASAAGGEANEAELDAPGVGIPTRAAIARLWRPFCDVASSGKVASVGRV